MPSPIEPLWLVTIEADGCDAGSYQERAGTAALALVIVLGGHGLPWLENGTLDALTVRVERRAPRARVHPFDR